MFRLPITDYRVPLTAHRLLSTVFRLPITDYRLLHTVFRVARRSCPPKHHHLAVEDSLPSQ